MTVQAQRCRSCGALIGWLRTAANRRMPVNYETIGDDEHEASQFDAKRHKSHFATCPQAAEHRRKVGRQSSDP